MYVIVRNGLFYSRTKTYPMMDIREHPIEKENKNEGRNY